MPYIAQDRRYALDRMMACLPSESEAFEYPVNCGELNYVLTMTCLRHDQIKFGGLDKKLFDHAFRYLTCQPIHYQRINDVIGACACAVLELERRCPSTRKFEIITLHHIASRIYVEMGAAYEGTKINENGDILEYRSPHERQNVC